jgi:putative ABC transport system permease protein
MKFATDISEGLRISLRALVANKMRAALTTLGIVIGVMTVILMITIILGLNKSVEKQFSFLGSNTLYVSRWDWFSNNWREMIKRKDMKVEYARTIERDSQLAEAVTPFGQVGTTISVRGNRLANVQVMGVTDQYAITNQSKVDLGRFLNESDVNHNRDVAVIGSGLAESLFDKVNPVGQTITIRSYQYRVIGVLEKMGKFFGQDMDNYALVPVGSFTKHFGRHMDMDIIVKAASAEQMDELTWELKGIMRRIRGLTPLEPDDFGINTQSMIMNVYKQVTGGIYFGGILIAAISLIVGGIGIMNIMLVSVTERTAEVGLRKALGAWKWMIAWQFMVESAIICSVGGIIGVVLAYIGSLLMDKYIPTAMPFYVAIFGILFAAIVGVFFGLYPAMKAARLSPIEALRQE